MPEAIKLTQLIGLAIQEHYRDIPHEVIAVGRKNVVGQQVLIVDELNKLAQRFLNIVECHEQIYVAAKNPFPIVSYGEKYRVGLRLQIQVNPDNVFLQNKDITCLLSRKEDEV